MDISDFPEFDEDFINKVYMYCYKHLFNSDMARDLAQDILLEALTVSKSDNKRQKIDNFYAWFWKMAHNKFCAYIKLQNNEAVSLDAFIGSPSESTFIDSDFDIAGNLINAEETAKLNQVIAGISKIHREVIILYYLKQHTTKQIAQMLNVPEGTVKRRLHDAKNEIQKGFSNSMSNNNFQSFAPAQLNMWGGYQVPKHWSIINDTMTKQILVSCIEPKSVSEISADIGVAPVYFEDKIKYLLDNKFIKETGKNRYIVDFIIYPQQIHADLSYEMADCFENIKDKLTDKLNNIKDKICAVDFYGNDFDFGYLLWVLYVYASHTLNDLMKQKYNEKWLGKIPENNGKDYRIAGSVTYSDEKINYKGKWKGISWSNLHQQFITPKYKVEYANLYEMYPFEEYDNTKGRDTWVNDKNITLLMKIYDNSEYEVTENEKEQAAHFISVGLVENRDGKLYLKLPVMTYKQRQKIFDIIRPELEDIAAEYMEKAAAVYDKLLLPLIREDMLEEYAHWIMSAAFDTIPYIFYENKYLQIPEDYSKSAAGLCLYLY